MKFISLFLILISVNDLKALTEISWDVDLVSHTQSNSAALLRIPDVGPGDMLYGVHVGSCPNANSSLDVYDSSLTATGKLFTLNTSSALVANGSQGCQLGTHQFHIKISSSISYVKTGGASITFLIGNFTISPQ